MNKRMILEALDKLGLGLSRLLRYSYGGFLLVCLMAILDPEFARPVREAMSWELVALSAVVVGAGLYALHRNAIVPFHHGLMCLVWWAIEEIKNTPPTKSANPARWLAGLGVPVLWCIPAYTILRRSDVFAKQKQDWNIAHAESGTVLMTSEAFLIGGLWALSQQAPRVNPTFLLSAAAALLVFSYAGWVQHAVECLQFRKNEAHVKQALQQLGFIP